MLRSIIEKLTRKCSPLALLKYLQQLILLAKVKQLEELTLKTIRSMPIDYNIEDSTLCKKGLEQGVEKALTDIAKRCLAQGKSHEETALITGLTIEQVKAIDEKK